MKSNLLNAILLNNQINHEDFITIINEERNYRELNESIRMMKGQEDKKKIMINLFKYKTMLSYCLKCKKNTESVNPRVSATSNGRTTILSKCAICGSKKSKFIKNQEAKLIANKIFCLSLHYNGDKSYLFVNGKEVTKFKAKKSEIKANQLTLESISTSANLSSSDIEDSKLYGNVYDFSVDYSDISNDKILDIHAYLMKKNGVV